ncbi:uncharacterized protein ACDL77_016730 [Rhynchocyon petersi]
MLIMSLLLSDRALRVPLVLLAQLGLLGLQDLRVVLDFLESEANRGHMGFRVQLALLVRKEKEVPEVIQEQLVLQVQWEKGVLLAIVVFQALMVYLDQRELKGKGVLWVRQDLKEDRGIQDVQVNLGCQVLGV